MPSEAGLMCPVAAAMITAVGLETVAVEVTPQMVCSTAVLTGVAASQAPGQLAPPLTISRHSLTRGANQTGNPGPNVPTATVRSPSSTGALPRLSAQLVGRRGEILVPTLGAAACRVVASGTISAQQVNALPGVMPLRLAWVSLGLL